MILTILSGVHPIVGETVISKALNMAQLSENIKRVEATGGG